MHSLSFHMPTEAQIQTTFERKREEIAQIVSQSAAKIYGFIL